MNISVIIPTFNGAPWLREALDGILAQELAPVDIVVVDDGSTDDSAAIAQSYGQVRFFRNPGKGSSPARNFGLLHAQGDAIAFLDQDDVWHPAHLRLLADVLERTPTARMAFANAACFDSGVPAYDLAPTAVSRFDPWTRFPFTIGVDGPSLALIPRSAVEWAGHWEEKSTGMGDALLFLKLAAEHPLVRLEKTTVGKRVHAGCQWLKVRAWSGPYLGFRIEVMESALAFRRAQRPDDPALPDLDRRLRALHAMRQLTTAIEAGDQAGIQTGARQLEAELHTDSPELLRHAFYCLMGALFPIHDNDDLRQARDGVFTRLSRQWPASAPRTLGALTALIGEQPRVS